MTHFSLQQILASIHRQQRTARVSSSVMPGERATQHLAHRGPIRACQIADAADDFVFCQDGQLVDATFKPASRQ